jgi:hypothetical protein
MAPCSPYYILGSTCDTFVVYRQLQNVGSAAWYQLGLGSLHSPDRWTKQVTEIQCSRAILPKLWSKWTGSHHFCGIRSSLHERQLVGRWGERLSEARLIYQENIQNGQKTPWKLLRGVIIIKMLMQADMESWWVLTLWRLSPNSNLLHIKIAYPDIVDAIKQQLESLCEASAPVTLVIVRATAVVVILNMAPEIFKKEAKDGLKFWCLDSFLWGWLHGTMLWSEQRAMRVAHKLPDDTYASAHFFTWHMG